MDRARNRTDKKLVNLERRIEMLYAESPSLSRMQKKFTAYMAAVDEKTADLYAEYINAEGDAKADAKAAYATEVKRLTVQNKHYRRLVKEIASTMAKVNQEAIDIINDEMVDIYTLNYNAVAKDCRKVGIEVDGKE